MEALSNELRILKEIDEKGELTFTELVNNTSLDLCRNTINKYLNLLREEKLIDIRHEKRKVYNFITPKGKLQLATILGKNNITSQIQSILLFEKKIKSIRDGFLERFGTIQNNNILIDCVENFITFSTYKFDAQLPSENFQYMLSYTLARYNLQYCKSEEWIRAQSSIIRLTQGDFFKKYKIDPVQINYFSKEWSKINLTIQIMDKHENMWFLTSNSFVYDTIMHELHIRTRRGFLQELIFENFIFVSSSEIIRILDKCVKSFRLQLDSEQMIQLETFIRRMLDEFLKQRKGYSLPWMNLPNDTETLLKMTLDLEYKIHNESMDISRKLELIRTIIEINNKLKNYHDVIDWANKYLEYKPDDPDILYRLAVHYFNLNKYSEFLNCADRLKQEFRYDIVLKPTIIKYFIEIKKDLNTALEHIEDTEQYILKNDTLYQIYPKILYYKAIVYKEMGNFDEAIIFAEKTWFQFESRDMELYYLVVELYKKLKNWESLEDFCLGAYRDDEYNPVFFPQLYYAYLKRKSNQKADLLYKKVKTNFPEDLKDLDKVRDEI